MNWDSVIGSRFLPNSFVTTMLSEEGLLETESRSDGIEWIIGLTFREALELWLSCDGASRVNRLVDFLDHFDLVVAASMP